MSFRLCYATGSWEDNFHVGKGSRHSQGRKVPLLIFHLVCRCAYLFSEFSCSLSSVFGVLQRKQQESLTTLIHAEKLANLHTHAHTQCGRVCISLLLNNKSEFQRCKGPKERILKSYACDRVFHVRANLSTILHTREQARLATFASNTGWILFFFFSV